METAMNYLPSAQPFLVSSRNAPPAVGVADYV